MLPFRIGMGHDIHALVPGRELWLGGIKIPFEMGLMGHSDADALLHAIMDALLGALALGDIGQLFPDSDAAFRGISSLRLLEQVMHKINETDYRVGNLDCMIHCEVPKIAPYRKAIIESLAKALKVEQHQISLKAGTNEGFDAIGKRQALACQAIVLMIRD